MFIVSECAAMTTMRTNTQLHIDRIKCLAQHSTHVAEMRGDGKEKLPSEFPAIHLYIVFYFVANELVHEIRIHRKIN